MKLSASVLIFSVTWIFILSAAHAATEKQRCVQDCLNYTAWSDSANKGAVLFYAECINPHPELGGPDRASCEAQQAECLKICDTKSDRWWEIWK
jgi:hypothetical protein